MELRRHTHRDERRRRVFMEEASFGVAADSAGCEASAPPPHETARSYSEAVTSARPRRVVDLVPARSWTLLVMALSTVTVATALEAVYGHLALGHTLLDVRQVPALDLAARGNIAQWFSSCLLLAAAGLGIVVYLIRRHRVDDYRGRYRMWCWIVPLLVVASVDQVSELQGSARAALFALVGTSQVSQAMLLWSVAMAVIVGAVALRLTLEMRASRLAVASLVMALAAYATAQAIQFNWLLDGASIFGVMGRAGAVLLGNILILMALGIYSRHVYRDAHGEIPPKVLKVKPKRAARQADKSTSAKPVSNPASNPTSARTQTTTTRIDKAHGASVPVAAKNSSSPPSSLPADPHEPAKRRPAAAAAAGAAPQSPIAGAAATLDPADDPALSRSERRRLRKLQRRGDPPSRTAGS